VSRRSATVRNCKEKMMSSKARMLAMALVTVLALGAGAQAAAAHGAPAPSPAAVPGTPVPLYDSAPGGPEGYEVVESGQLDDPAGIQTHGEVTCPDGKVPVGGGAQILSSALGENLASSYPTTEGWAVDFNNATTAAGSFDIYAVCASPKGYVIVHYGPFIARAGHQGGADDGCLKGTKLLGGGAQATTTDVSISLNESFPTLTNQWAVYMANASPQSVDFYEYGPDPVRWTRWGWSTQPSP
jgi:hypothetical protein